MSMFLERTVFQPYVGNISSQYGFRLYNEDGFAEFCDGLSPEELDRDNADFLRMVMQAGGLSVQSALETLADQRSELCIDGKWYRLSWEDSRHLHIKLQLL